MGCLTGLEPATFGTTVRRSTIELQATGADGETRTLTLLRTLASETNLYT